MDPAYLGLAIFLGLAISVALISGETMSIMRGFGPWVVTRKDHPRLFWLSVGSMSVFVAVFVAILAAQSAGLIGD
jgi:hypothetical protein